MIKSDKYTTVQLLSFIWNIGINTLLVLFPIFLPKWTIYKHVSNKNKKYLSVGNFGILSVVCNATAAYTSLFRNLKLY